MDKEAEVISGLKEQPAPMGLTADQNLIWDEFERAKIKTLKKNLAYGSTVFTPCVLASECPLDVAIRVRMSDKINRLKTLLADPTKNLIDDEAVEDTMRDLGTYAFLCLIARAKIRQSAAAEFNSSHADTLKFPPSAEAKTLFLNGLTFRLPAREWIGHAQLCELMNYPKEITEFTYRDGKNGLLVVIDAKTSDIPFVDGMRIHSRTGVR